MLAFQFYTESVNGQTAKRDFQVAQQLKLVIMVILHLIHSNFHR